MIYICTNINNIEFKEVSFSYDKQREVLKKFSLYAKRDNVVVISGENGIGKTTAMNLLLGIWNEYKGNIFIDGTDIRELCRENLLDKISFCFQKSVIFNDSIKNNIFLDGEYNEELLNILCERMKLKDLIEELDKGIDSNINETEKLSGGQFQKIGIIRTLITEKPIIIFDEPTSSLDSDSCKEFMKLILDYKKDRIIFLITHDKDMLEIADYVYEF
ncbi:MAG: ABC transporter ATP-binding protein [Clostridium sp.]